MDEYFYVVVGDKNVEFRSIISTGRSGVMKQFPNLDAAGITQKVRELDLQRYDTKDPELSRIFRLYSDRSIIDVFIKNWWAVARDMNKDRSKVLVSFYLLVNNVASHWEYSG
jgi:hypothetical protein